MESLGDILKRLTERNTFDAGESSLLPAEEEGRPPCSVCGGTRWVVKRGVAIGHPDFGKARPCQCNQESQEQRLSRFQRYSNLGLLTKLRFDNLNLEGRTQDAANQALFRRAYEGAKGFAEVPQGWLVLAGVSGCGKTHMAAAVANHCLEQGRLAFFATVPDLLDHLRATFSPDSDLSYDEMFELVKNTPFLVLDDLGAHSSTPWANEKLYQVLNHRSMAGLPTVITLGLPLEKLEERVRTRLSNPKLCQVFDLERRLPSALLRIGVVPQSLLDSMSFESFDVRGNNADVEDRESLERAYKAARAFAQEPEGWLLLSGGTGCGKTHLAVSIAGYRKKQGTQVFYISAGELLDELRRTLDSQSEVTYHDLFEQVKNSELLILENLDAQPSTAWASEKLEQLITYRHDRRLPTVITTRALAKDFSGAVAFRLQDVHLVSDAPISAGPWQSQSRQRAVSRGGHRR